MVKCEDCRKKIIEKNKGKSDEELFFEKWSDEKYCLEQVEQNGYSLQYVKEQTEEICMKAVEQDGYSLRYVKDKKIFLKIHKGGRNSSQN